jgi:hypothetical protein
MRGVAGGRWPVAGFLAAALAATTTATVGVTQMKVVDDFASVGEWTAAPSDGVTLGIAGDRAPEGPAMRLDFDFHGHGGWAAMRKTVDLDLPDNYEFTFRIRGTAPVENLEFKLVDASGDNVWWSVRRDFEFPQDWQTLRIRKRQISFAWGPAGGGELKRAAAIELAITAGSGGKGSVWISELTLVTLPAEHPYAGTPVVTASSSLPDRAPAQALGGTGGGWHSDPAESGPQWIAIYFGERRELGGLIIDWDPAPVAFDVLTSEDGTVWTAAWHVEATHGGRSYVPLPDTNVRALRLGLTSVRPGGVGARHIAVEAPDFTATPNDFIAAVAKRSRRGLYPRGFLGEATAWTVVGRADGTQPVGLLGADGAFEPAPGSFSLEPFLFLDGALITWADVIARPSLADGYLPVPTVTWGSGPLELAITPLAIPDRAQQTVRYRLANRGSRRIAPVFFLAARPFQVDPPSQFLNGPGGVARLAAAACEQDGVRLDHMHIRAFPAPDRCGATGFDDGDVTSVLQAGSIPSTANAEEPYPSAALAWRVDLNPGAAVELVVTFGEPALSPAQWNVRLAEVAAEWRTKLGRVSVGGAPEVDDFVRTMTTNVAYILESRDGPALRPGTRSYARSWIRDGAMMAAALLRLGHDEEVRDYLRWYAPYQFAGGRVPCCVDHRGADPVPENDSNGEFLFLAGEYLRYTSDTATVAALWPHLVSAVRYLDELCRQSISAPFRTPRQSAFFGLLPASISHEGYSAKPMHSYWDDLWALAGLDEAVWMAKRFRHTREATDWAVIRDAFRADLLASIARVREAKGLAYVPGCAELGDFDPTSTTVAVWPADAGLPRDALDATYERYWREAEARFTGTASWESYTPYEWRNVGAFVRLGWRDRAVRLARWLMADRTPPGWNQWPEVVWRDRTHAHFLGDLPHAWVGSDFIRSFLDMLAYERPADGALVVASGVPLGWLDHAGVTVHNLRTRYGPLSFQLRRDGDAVRVHVNEGIRVPPAGVVLRPPLPQGEALAVVNGVRQGRMVHDELVVRTLPADVLFTPTGEER